MAGPLNPPSSPATMDVATPFSSSLSSFSLRKIILAAALCSSFIDPTSSFSAGQAPITRSNSVSADFARTTRTDIQNLGSASRLQIPSSSRPAVRCGGGTSPTSLSMVWWFGGTANQEINSSDDDSCELVAVRIEKPTSNSRRIAGEIVVDRPADDVWAILTDYDNLSVHVPNLVESRRVSGGYYNPNHERGEQGDGKYKCRLFQKGAQKIVGFEFGASVTMDMTESIVVRNPAEERKISFRCVESQFFSVFDGDWTVIESPMPDPMTGQPVTTVKYVVDVKPKGPVPVAALEWRIREDVPTNLRAVKKAAMDVGEEGVLAMRRKLSSSAVDRAIIRDTVRTPVRRAALQDGKLNPVARRSVTRGARQVGSAARTARQLVGRASSAVSAVAVNTTKPRRKLAPVRVDWYEDETMAAYLKDP